MARDPVDVLARTLYGEARGELYGGKVAVANVVMNRVARRSWFGEGVIGVCLKPWQFSCWNEGDPNRKVIEAVTEATPQFRECLEIAREAVAGRLPDLTFGSAHYFARYIAAPKWAIGKRPVVQIGVHFFFNDVQ